MDITDEQLGIIPEFKDCPKCGRCFKRLRRHLSRKYPCNEVHKFDHTHYGSEYFKNAQKKYRNKYRIERDQQAVQFMLDQLNLSPQQNVSNNQESNQQRQEIQSHNN